MSGRKREYDHIGANAAAEERAGEIARMARRSAQHEEDSSHDRPVGDTIQQVRPGGVLGCGAVHR
jgi:hypothetical protein